MMTPYDTNQLLYAFMAMMSGITLKAGCMTHFELLLQLLLFYHDEDYNNSMV